MCSHTFCDLAVTFKTRLHYKTELNPTVVAQKEQGLELTETLVIDPANKITSPTEQKLIIFTAREGSGCTTCMKIKQFLLGFSLIFVVMLQ